MSEKDFDLDIKITSLDNNGEVNITSVSLCTEGCVTGPINCHTQTCFTCQCPTFTCG